MTVVRTRIFCLSISLMAFFFTACTGVRKENRPPNIVFILADDLGWSDLGCYGNSFHETPYLDEFAEGALLFTDAYASSPICSPTRASILTGKHPATLALTDWIPGRQHQIGTLPSDKLIPPDFEQQLNLQENTLAELLKEKGYVTANIGKWHLGDSLYYPENQGFDVNVTGNHFGSPASYFFPYEHPRRKGYKFDKLNKNGKEGEYLTDRLTHEAISFIKKNKDHPFFLYLPHYAVHTPLTAKDSLVDYFRQKRQYMSEDSFGNPIYAAMLYSLDQSVHNITRALKELNLEENTIVIFTSDNGGLSVEEGPNTPATSNKPLRQGKGYLGEGGIRVPLIIRWPGKTKPGQTSQAVSSVDFVPTFIEGLQLESSAHDKLDGKSFVGTLNNPAQTSKEAIFWHYPHYSNQGGKPSGAIRKGKYKLVEYFENDALELFDLEADSGETKNLTKELPETARELHQELQQWRNKKDAGMPKPNPDFETVSKQMNSD